MASVLSKGEGTVFGEKKEGGGSVHHETEGMLDGQQLPWALGLVVY